jgi:hypothetical protein
MKVTSVVIIRTTSFGKSGLTSEADVNHDTLQVATVFISRIRSQSNAHSESFALYTRYRAVLSDYRSTRVPRT